MAIRPIAAPGLAQAAMDEVASSRSLSRDGDGPELIDLGGGDGVEAAASDPLPVYTIPIASLAEDGASQVGDAVQRGWRVRTVDAGGDQLVDLSFEGEPLGIRRGRSSEILLRAADLAEEMSDPDATYEPRLLDFGQLGLSALWLHREDGPDRFFPLDREASECREEELLEEAARRARRYLGRDLDDARKRDVPDLGG